MTFIFVILILLFAAIIIIANFFCDIAVARQNKPFISNDPEMITSFKVVEDEYKEYLQKQDAIEVELYSYRKTHIRGFYYENGSNVVAICVHGYCSSHKYVGSFVKMYKEEFGFDVLAPDLRGCGDSKGKYIGFGNHDRFDIQKWIEYIISKKGQNVKIILHGISMGGATVLMTSGEKLPSNVKLIVSDCAYSSTYEILAHQLTRQFHLPPVPLMRLVNLTCKMRYGYSFREGEVKKFVSRSKTPVLFIHGALDDFVPYKMVYELFEYTKSPKVLHLVEGASHAESFYVERTNYINWVREFIDKFVI